MLIGISSPYRRSGLLFERWRQFYGSDDDDVLVIKGPSTVFNPTIDQKIINAALERDPEAGAAEWLGEWRSDLADFVSREVVDAAVVPGRWELPSVRDRQYHAFVDPSGGSSDSMTLAIAHAEGETAVLDLVREIRPPFSPEAVVIEFAAVLKNYGIGAVTGDRYGGDWPRERFRVHGIEYLTATQSKAEIYVSLLPLLNSGKVELLDHKRMITQLCQLERRVARGGREAVGHPIGGRDDVINSIAGAIVAAARPGSSALIAEPIVMINGYSRFAAIGGLTPDPDWRQVW
jgi:hypothetical protein